MNSCVAVGSYGSYWVRTAQGWGSLQADPPTADAVTALSCASADDCVAWDQRLSYGTYNGKTWTALAHRTIRLDRVPTSVSCPSTSFCLVVTNSGAYAERVDGRWQRPFRDIRSTSISATDVACASSKLCLAVTGAAKDTATGSVTAFDGKRWGTAARPHGQQVVSVSCADGVRFCAAGTKSGSVTLYTGRAWSSPTRLPGAHAVGSVSCSSRTFCMAVSGNRAYAYNGAKWRAFTVAGRPTLSHVSCASSQACAAIGRRTATYFDGTSCSAAKPVYGTGDNVAIVCPAVAKCVMATSGGQAIVSR